MNRLTRQQIAARVARDLPDGAYVNLGIGIPTLVADHIPADRDVIIHSENGVLGIGPAPTAGRLDPELINAGKDPVTLLPGGAYFHHADSFAMIRGGHIDVSVLGAFQVSASGDLANWSTGEDGIPSVGGAMDLAVGACAVYAVMTHVTSAGAPKLVERCSLPLTGAGVVTRVYTDLAVLRPAEGCFEILELVDGLDLAELGRLTAAPLREAT